MSAGHLGQGPVDPAGLRAQLTVARRYGWVIAAREGGRLRGALIGLPPHAQPPPLPPFLERIRLVVLQGPRASARWARVAETLQELRPTELHGYLSILGVDPLHRGRGVGSELLAGFVARVDRDALPAYLETDAESNVAFYARAGFQVLGDLRVLGVPVWRLWRPAAGRDTA